MNCRWLITMRYILQYFISLCVWDIMGKKVTISVQNGERHFSWKHKIYRWFNVRYFPMIFVCKFRWNISDFTVPWKAVVRNSEGQTVLEADPDFVVNCDAEDGQWKAVATSNWRKTSENVLHRIASISWPDIFCLLVYFMSMKNVDNCRCGTI